MTKDEMQRDLEDLQSYLSCTSLIVKRLEVGSLENAALPADHKAAIRTHHSGRRICRATLLIRNETAPCAIAAARVRRKRPGCGPHLPRRSRSAIDLFS